MSAPIEGNLKLGWTIDGQQQDLTSAGPRVVIGRLPACDAVLRSDSVSRQHAEFLREGDEWSVRDLKSKNGVFVNEVRVHGRHVVRSGDHIRLGTVDFSCTIIGRLMPSRPSSVVIDDTDFTGNMTGSIQMDEFHTMLEESLVPDRAQTSTGVTPQRIAGLFHDAAQTLLSGRTLDEILEQVLELTFRHLPAERGYVCIRQGEEGEMVPMAKRSCEGIDCEFRVSKTIVKHTIEDKKAVLFRDEGVDPRFGENTPHSIVMGNIQSAMCAPLYADGKVGGYIYIDTQDQLKPFVEDHLEILSALAAVSAVAVEQTRLRENYEREQQIRARLSRYSSPNVVDRLIRDAGTDEGSMMADEAQVSVLFADLSGFTPLSEALSAADVTQLLNSIFERLTDAVFAYDGTLDKFIGDEIMVFFGAPIAQEDHAERAVRCALQMQELMAAFNSEQPPESRLSISIGINSGEVIVGDIGSEERRDYTVIGSTVNTAKRIETYCSEGGMIVIGPNTFQLVAQVGFDCLPLEPKDLKGLPQPVQTYVVRG